MKEPGLEEQGHLELTEEKATGNLELTEKKTRGGFGGGPSSGASLGRFECHSLELPGLTLVPPIFNFLVHLLDEHLLAFEMKLSHFLRSARFQ